MTHPWELQRYGPRPGITNEAKRERLNDARIPSALESAQEAGPALGAFPVAVLDGDQLLRAVEAHPDHHQRAQSVLLQADAEVDAVGPRAG